MRKRLFEIIEASRGEDRASSAYDAFMILVIVLSLVPLAFKGEHPALAVLDKVCACIFALDYLARLATADFKYGSASALNVARGGGVPEDRLVEFRGGERFSVGEYRVAVLPSLHSAPTILNNDLGQTIDAPLKQPARLRDYREGGSFDFYVEHGGRRFLIRPSFNFIEGQLDGLRADALFLGVSGLGKADPRTEEAFFRETVDRVSPKLVVPIHWDNFFIPLDRPARRMPRIAERTERAFYRLARACESRGVACLVQLPRTCVDI